MTFPPVPIVVSLELLRHGEALPAGEGGDDARRLSPAGLRDLDRLGLHLARLDWRPDRAFTSPLARARESAAIVLRHLPGFAAEPLDALRPECEPEDVIAALDEAGVAGGATLLVGHQPLLGRLAAWLTGEAPPALAPGTLVRLDLAGPPARGAARLAWTLRPGNLA